MTTIHAAPRPENSRTTCCGKMPADLPDSDRLSAQPELVTCTVILDRQRRQDAEASASFRARRAFGERRDEMAASVAAALRALIDDTDWEMDDHDGRLGHVPYSTYTEARRILARWDRLNLAPKCTCSWTRGQPHDPRCAEA